MARLGNRPGCLKATPRRVRFSIALMEPSGSAATARALAAVGRRLWKCSTCVAVTLPILTFRSGNGFDPSMLEGELRLSGLGLAVEGGHGELDGAVFLWDGVEAAGDELEDDVAWLPVRSSSRKKSDVGGVAKGDANTVADVDPPGASSVGGSVASTLHRALTETGPCIAVMVGRLARPRASCRSKSSR